MNKANFDVIANTMEGGTYHMLMVPMANDDERHHPIRGIVTTTEYNILVEQI